MKGIYLSEEGKKEIEAKIAELEKHIENVIKIADIASDKTYVISKTYLEIEFRTKQNTLKEILASAIVLPVESNMSYVKSYDFVFSLSLLLI